MIRLLKWLFTGDWHLHEYEEVRNGKMTDDYGNIWTRYSLRCKVCGEMKTFDTKK